MINTNLLTGDLVRLVAVDPERDAALRVPSALPLHTSRLPLASRASSVRDEEGRKTPA